MSLDLITHYPVMLDNVLTSISKPKVVVDCTFGGGGYSRGVLEKFTDAFVIGLDRDSSVNEQAKKIKDKYGNRFIFYNKKFSEIDEIDKFEYADHFLFDLGVSNFHLKMADRGFSFAQDSKLDMRMGLNEISAIDIVNKCDEYQLYKIIKYFGEDKDAKKISKNIIRFRKSKNINSTFELKNIIESVKNKFTNKNPSTKTFQAIRMIVNKELTEIYLSLNKIIEKAKIGSKIIVVSFHSLEDRLVKKIFNFYGKKQKGSRYMPEVLKESCLEIFQKKPILPSDKEIVKNPSSRSAKLRSVVKINKPLSILLRKELNMEEYFKLEEQNEL